MKLIMLDICGGLLLLSLLGTLFRLFPSILEGVGFSEKVTNFFRQPPKWFPTLITASFVIGIAVLSVWLAVGIACLFAAAKPEDISLHKISMKERMVLGIVGAILVGRGIFSILGWAAVIVVAVSLAGAYAYRQWRFRSGRGSESATSHE